MDNALVLSHLDAGVLTLTLNRPDRLNSFNDEMHRQLSEALTQAERDDSVRSLLIAGAGRGFCAGQDLNDRNVSADQQAPDLGLSVERFYNPLIRRLTALPKPVVCAVNGVAAGAGAALALACDIVIAADNAGLPAAEQDWATLQAFVAAAAQVPERGTTSLIITGDEEGHTAFDRQHGRERLVREVHATTPSMTR